MGTVQPVSASLSDVVRSRTRGVFAPLYSSLCSIAGEQESHVVQATHGPDLQAALTRAPSDTQEVKFEVRHSDGGKE
jgi:hypothetical protein